MSIDRINRSASACMPYGPLCTSLASCRAMSVWPRRSSMRAFSSSDWPWTMLIALGDCGADATAVGVAGVGFGATGMGSVVFTVGKTGVGTGTTGIALATAFGFGGEGACATAAGGGCVVGGGFVAFGTAETMVGAGELDGALAVTTG